MCFKNYSIGNDCLFSKIFKEKTIPKQLNDTDVHEKCLQQRCTSLGRRTKCLLYTRLKTISFSKSFGKKGIESLPQTMIF